MDRSQALKSLELIARVMNEVTRFHESELCYDILSDSLYWSDDFPPLSQLEPGHVFQTAMRIVLGYRTSLILGSPDEQFSDFWEKAKSLFPDWIGFHPDRCTANPDLAKEYVRMKKEAEDACDLLQDYD